VQKLLKIRNEMTREELSPANDHFFRGSLGAQSTLSYNSDGNLLSDGTNTYSWGREESVGFNLRWCDPAANTILYGDESAE
jgi:hypothetical protein